MYNNKWPRTESTWEMGLTLARLYREWRLVLGSTFCVWLRRERRETPVCPFEYVIGTKLFKEIDEMPLLCWFWLVVVAIE